LGILNLCLLISVLEYGTPELPPAPVIRMASIRAQEKLVPLIKEELSKLGLSRGSGHAK